MSKAEELKELAESGTLDRLSTLKNNRELIYEVTGMRVPRSVAEADDWYDRKKSVLMRRINKQLETEDSDEQTDEESEEDTEEDNEE